jgi:hypothetical protein
MVQGNIPQAAIEAVSTWRILSWSVLCPPLHCLTVSYRPPLLLLLLLLFLLTTAAVGEPGMLSKGLAGPHPATPAKAAFMSWRSYGLDSSSSGYSNSSSSSVSPGAPVTPGSPLKTALGGFWSRSGTAACMSSADAAAQFGTLQRPQSPSGSGSGGRPLKGWEKYPGFLELTLAAKPRPAPEVLLVVTDPAAGVRPDVPAGYGSGFEHGKYTCGIPRKVVHISSCSICVGNHAAARDCRTCLPAMAVAFEHVECTVRQTAQRCSMTSSQLSLLC